jgi:rhodanese-related sulfurtransferase
MITKEQLKAILDEPDLVILDVRLGSDYFSSDSKIKGAIRPDMGALIWHTVSQHPTENMFVVYCSSAIQEQSLLNAKLLIEGNKDLGHEPRKKVYALKGGWEEWLRAGLPTEDK